MFWSGETIKNRLSEIISLEDGTPPSANQIDCNALTLRVGPEYYLTPQDHQDSYLEPKAELKINQQFWIPPGQFVFLLTEEIVHVPKNAMAFISFKGKQKLKGLINVSGFHVDPGFKGRIIFSLYNTGPKPIPLTRRADLFLIWFADLDNNSTTEYRKKEELENMIIKDEIVGNITGEIISPINLNKKLTSLGEKFNSHKIETRTSLLAVFIGLSIGLIYFFLNHIFDPMKEFVSKEIQNQDNKINELKQENVRWKDNMEQLILGLKEDIFSQGKPEGKISNKKSDRKTSNNK